MTGTLPRVTHEHHERVQHYVDRIPETADLLLTAPIEELQPRLDEISDALNGLLLPHLEAAEAALYPELERLMQNHHSTTPMRREHDAVRRRITEIETLHQAIDGHRPTVGQAIGMRRALYRLYALVKIHLGEEEIYIHLIDRGVAPEAGEALAAAMEHPVGVQ